MVSMTHTCIPHIRSEQSQMPLPHQAPNILTSSATQMSLPSQTLSMSTRLTRSTITCTPTILTSNGTQMSTPSQTLSMSTRRTQSTTTSRNQGSPFQLRRVCRAARPGSKSPLQFRVASLTSMCKHFVICLCLVIRMYFSSWHTNSKYR